VTTGKTEAILLVNLGSPDSPTEADVRRYLNQFLMDGRVLDAPYLIRRMIVSFFILPKRPKQSAEAYQAIWWDEGSPLVVISERVHKQVQARVDLPVGLAMSYGSPSIPTVIKRLVDDSGGALTNLRLIPLFPHYAMSTFETVIVAVQDAIARIKPSLNLSAKTPFYVDPSYINALAANTKPYLEGTYDHLLFSYHGLPERHLKKTDPTGHHCLGSENCCSTPSPAHKTCYRAQVFQTTKAFVDAVGIPPEKYSVAFQSRLGRDPWLQPYTDKTLERLAHEGVKRIKVMCPAFVSDCLETLEEIGIRGKASFMHAGGESFELIPCLNEHPLWIDTLVRWCGDPSVWAEPEQLFPS